MLTRLIKTTLVTSLLTLSLSAIADEVWDTNVGQFVYQDEVGPVAVWTYGTPEDPGVVYINGLAKVYENRGSYDGYWAMSQARAKCKTARIGKDGEMTYYWGRFQVHFIDKNFPSRWVANWSYCNAGPQKSKIMGKPQVADD